ncbi:F-box only protein 15 [Larimichthys crocea]|uniref:F-box only protein 15 n=1 Tax=Larimichthys crocea TaxID=215358 RepID=UPI000F601D26|nr:F-box only protein 15 [Larimichthys crocea]
MAAGRGEFFRSLLAGLERKPGPGGGQRGPGERQPGPGGGQRGPSGGQPGPGGGQPGPGGGQPGPGGRQRGGRRRKRPLRGAPSSVGGKERSRSERQKVKTSSRENFIERLPSEILIKILSYLDSPSLFCIGHVSKLFHRLSSDDVMWHKIYNAEFGKQVWKPKWWDEPALKVDPAEAEDQSAGRWKKLYFRTVAGQEMSKWRRELTDINPYTGLPKHTERVLRSLNVSWELTVCDRFGHEKTMEQSRAYFFKSSAIVCWSNGSFPKYHHISNIQLHGVRKEAPKSPEVRRPAWRSLILKLDMKTQPGWFFGKDRLIKLMHLPPGFIVGIWRGQSDVAFIMVSLHLHKLVEKSLLGSPVCPYSEPADLPPVDDLDPEFGLHGYALHFVLHNTGSEIMLGHFCKLSCHTVQIQRGWVELRVINRTNLSQHRAMSGNITMPWKSDALEGSVENCCIISLTLLDEIQKPFWCVSSPIRVTMVKKTPSSDYSGEHFAMDYQNPEGQVKMSLVWLKEQKQFFLISLIIYVPVFKVNKHFSTEY